MKCNTLGGAGDGCSHFVNFKRDSNLSECNGVTEWNEFSRFLAALNRRNTRHSKHITFFGITLLDAL